jgi:hypothetical protein
MIDAVMRTCVSGCSLQAMIAHSAAQRFFSVEKISMIPFVSTYKLCCFAPPLQMKFLVCVVLVLLGCSAPVQSAASQIDPQDMPGLQLLLDLHGDAARETYRSCKQTHGDACKVPCKAISGCAGCVPEDGNTCIFCLAGHTLSADKKSCTPCAEGSVSKGGRASTCDACDVGMIPVQGSYACVESASKPAKTPRAPGNVWCTGSAIAAPIIVCTAASSCCWCYHSMSGDH